MEKTEQQAKEFEEVKAAWKKKNRIMLAEEVEKLIDEKLKKQEVCPNCGKCPVCGKSTYWPYMPYPSYYPYSWAPNLIPAGPYYTDTRTNTNTS